MSRRPKDATLRFYKERLLRVLVHIQEHLDGPLALNELARLACLSPHHFHHVFTGMLQEPLATHVRRLRLERAAGRLTFTKTPVVEIAFEAGYETHEAFTRAFHKAFGLSPAQFRTRNGVKALIQNPSGVHYRNGERLGKFHAARIGDKSAKVIVVDLKPMRAAFARHVGPYRDVGKTWDRFLMLLGKDGWAGGDARFIGICHDDPAVTSSEKIRYDACATVDERFRPQGEIGVQTIPGGSYAMLTHFGPYEKLGESYASLLGQWLPHSGQRLRTTPCFEVYFNSPENTEPEDLVTDIHAPLEPK